MSKNKLRECCQAWFKNAIQTQAVQRAVELLELHLKEHGAIFPADPKPMNDLTDRQREVFGFICSTISENGNAPTVREIAAHIGVTGLNAVTGHLEALQAKGYIRRGNSIRVLGVRWQMVEVESCG